MEQQCDTLENNRFNRKSLWVNVYRLPHHLWTENNAETNGREIGDYLQAYEDCLTLSRLEVMRIKIERQEPLKGWKAITVYDGV